VAVEIGKESDKYLNLLDDHSRLLLNSTAFPTLKAADVVQAFFSASDSYGLPASFLSDNGAVFSGRSRGGKVRRDRIDSKGKVTLRYLSKLRHIPVGASHRNRKVLLLVAGADVRIVTTDGTLLGQLTLDPDRNYQPLGGRQPVQNVLQQVSTMS
jgi:transposase InsO family protein